MDNVLSLLEAHPYLLLFPLVMLEGPLTTICAGFMVAAGFASWPIVYAIAVGADLTADTLYYLLGRSGSRPRPRRLVRRFGLTEERLARLEKDVRRNAARALIGAKIVDAVAIPVMVATGLARVGYGRFLAWNAVATLARAAVLMTLGFLFGERAIRYLDRTSAFVVLVALALALFVTVRILSNRTSKEDNDGDLAR
jgi:membrane protein DedA with SNARE-associated domain